MWTNGLGCVFPSRKFNSTRNHAVESETEQKQNRRLLVELSSVAKCSWLEGHMAQWPNGWLDQHNMLHSEWKAKTTKTVFEDSRHRHYGKYVCVPQYIRYVCIFYCLIMVGALLTFVILRDYLAKYICVLLGIFGEGLLLACRFDCITLSVGLFFPLFFSFECLFLLCRK